MESALHRDVPLKTRKVKNKRLIEKIKEKLIEKIKSK
jgi:hypothetical protein